MLCHNYIFFDTKPSLNDIPENKLADFKKQFAEHVANEKKVKTSAYATLGFAAGTRFMLWMQADEAESIQNLLNDLLHTDLGHHLTVHRTLFGLIRPSQYSKHRPEDNKAIEGENTKKYLVVYPFTKTKQWYLKSFDERKTLMIGHMKVGGGFSHIEQVLLYSFGVDNDEFIVSYKTDSLVDFQTLVMELRSTEARMYTENDMPVFTCVHKTISEVLDFV